MNDDLEPPSGNLPAVVQVPPLAAPQRSEGGREHAMLNALSPEELVRVARKMLDLVDASESDPARVSAAKLVLDRFAPKENIEQKRRETEERNDAIAEAKGFMAEFAASKSAGLYEPFTLDQDRPSGAIDAAGHAEEMAGLADSGGQGLGQDA